MIGYIEAYISIDTLEYSFPFTKLSGRLVFLPTIIHIMRGYLQGVCAISSERRKGGF